jgi:hypothetical protein
LLFLYSIRGQSSPQISSAVCLKISDFNAIAMHLKSGKRFKKGRPSFKYSVTTAEDLYKPGVGGISSSSSTAFRPKGQIAPGDSNVDTGGEFNLREIEERRSGSIVSSQAASRPPRKRFSTG